MTDLTGKTKEELVDIIKELAQECDCLTAHNEVLEKQVVSLGGRPIQDTFLHTSLDTRAADMEASLSK